MLFGSSIAINRKQAYLVAANKRYGGFDYGCTSKESTVVGR
jgi:hypothetical protein